MKLLYIAMLFFTQGFFLLSFSQKDNPKFSHITTREGLSQSTVSAILKDRKGFMWFATSDGLNKYDGYTFTIYRHNRKTFSSISNNFVYEVMEDKAANLWIGTASSLDKFDRKTDSFTHYRPAGINDINVKAVFEDSKSRLWIGTTDGFYLFNAAKGTFRAYRHSREGNSLSNDVIYRICESNDGKLWIATKDGLNTFTPETGVFSCYKNEPGNSSSIGGNWIKSVYKDNKGNIWAGTQGNGISMFNPKGNNFINYTHSDANLCSIGYNDILSFAQDKEGNLWVGTENGGISLFDYATNSFKQYLFDSNDNFSLSNNSVYSIYRDNIDNMWIGTWSGGVNMLPHYGDKFNHYKQMPGDKNSLSSNFILSITGDSYGTVWIGTDGGGLNRFDKTAKTFSNYRHNSKNKNSISSDYVLSVIEVEPGLLLIGYQRGGFDLFKIKTGVSTHYIPAAANANSLSILTVNVVYKDRSGLLWLGTWGGGLDTYNRRTNSFIHYKNNPADSNTIDNNFINTIYEDNHDNIWVGTDLGLNLLDKKSNGFIHYISNAVNKQSISDNIVESMMTDKAGNTWIATNGGVNLFNSKKNSFTAFTENEGLPSNMTHDILEDKKGNLWISSNHGISKFDPLRKVCRNYGLSDGLQGEEFKSRCAYQAPDGQMFFGGSNGINAFYPDSIRDNDFIPPVYITGFDIFNKQVIAGDSTRVISEQISEAKKITLNYNQSVFSFGFSALNYTLPDKNQYAYMMEGFDKDWNYAGTKRTATYTNLDPGTYTFKVRGSNNDGIWNMNGASIKVIIRPPFWLTWWFKLLATIIIVAGVITFDRLRVNAINEQKIVLQQQVKQQTLKLLKSTEQEQKARMEAEKANINLEMKNKELEQFAYVASHDLQEPLRTTSSFIGLIQKQYKGQLDERADKYFNYILDATGRMKELIKNLLDYSRIGSTKEMEQVDCNLLLGNVIADLHVAIEEAQAVISCASLPIIHGYPNDIKQLFQNLLINAIKFRKKDTYPEIIITAQKLNSGQEFMFKDNGIGIEEKNIKKIFNIFQRLHSRAEYEGSGIGLSHCKKIVELHHGKIWVESTPGAGSTFHFTIPDNAPKDIYEKVTGEFGYNEI